MPLIPLLDIAEKTVVPLSQLPGWPETVHQFDEDSVWAVRAAQAARRPLLVRGEPGTGKSQLARAAAAALGCAFIAEVVHSRTEAQDLQYHFDAVRRLGEAQACGGRSGNDISELLAPGKYLSPGVLWWAFDWDTASRQAEQCATGGGRPEPPPEWGPAKGCVLLIDEIDKADADLPNGLLETLGNGSFTVPYTRQVIGLGADVPPPLVFITTNEERELPAAFVRRCLVLHLALPEKEADLIPWLMDRGRIHFPGAGAKIREETARLLCQDRLPLRQQQLPAPGQAEYLDLLRALTRFSGEEREQRAALEKIGRFALKKQTL